MMSPRRRSEVIATIDEPLHQVPGTHLLSTPHDVFGSPCRSRGGEIQ